MLLSEFEHDDRKACVFYEDGNFIVIKMCQDCIVEEKVLRDKTEEYAEAYAEDWVLGTISLDNFREDKFGPYEIVFDADDWPSNDN